MIDTSKNGGGIMRVGFGYDIHRLETGAELILGGVKIPSSVGTVGHSDADALTHAIIDAMLGASGLGDIGEHFPPSDPGYRGISSITLLEKTVSLVANAGFVINNLDTVIILQKPALSPYKQKMRTGLAGLLRLGIEQVNIKAKTKEGVDAVGEGRAVESYAVVLLEKT